MDVKRERLDVLVQRQAGVTRSKAQGLIQTGQVWLDGRKLDKPGLRLPEETALDIREQPRFVSRGGEKLEAALQHFQIDVRGRTALDIGASTGGFTDCLLQHGAARVFAVDVGYGQLAWKLRTDPRVVVLERCNVRNLTPDQLPALADFFTVDCSFISLQLILAPIAALVASKADGVLLIKPQFEAGRELVGKGGVVRDAAVHEAVIQRVSGAAREVGFSGIDVIPSPLLGPAGNREFLAHVYHT